MAPVRFSSLRPRACRVPGGQLVVCFGVRPATAVDGSSLTCRVFTSLIKSSALDYVSPLAKTARCCSSVDLYAFSTRLTRNPSACSPSASAPGAPRTPALAPRVATAAAPGPSTSAGSDPGPRARETGSGTAVESHRGGGTPGPTPAGRGSGEVLPGTDGGGRRGGDTPGGAGSPRATATGAARSASSPRAAEAWTAAPSGRRLPRMDGHPCDVAPQPPSSSAAGSGARAAAAACVELQLLLEHRPLLLSHLRFLRRRRDVHGSDGRGDQGVRSRLERRRRDVKRLANPRGETKRRRPTRRERPSRRRRPSRG